MNPLTESREAVVEALRGIGVTVYGAPPENVTPPAVVILPDSEWAVQVTMGALRVNWQLTLMATMQGSNAAAMERLEQLYWDVRQKLASVAQVGDPVAPRVLKMGTAEVAATDVPVGVYVTTEEGSQP